MSDTANRPGGPAAASTRRQFQRLDGDGHPVLVRQSHTDMFVMQAANATAAMESSLRAAELLSQFSDQIERVVARITEWCEAHQSVARAVFKPVSSMSPALTCEIYTTGEWHDAELDDALTDLDIELAEAFKNFDIRVRSVPARFRQDGSGHWNEGEANVVYSRSGDTADGGR